MGCRLHTARLQTIRSVSCVKPQKEGQQFCVVLVYPKIKHKTPVMVDATLHPANFRLGLKSSNCSNVRMVVETIKNGTETKKDHRAYRNSKFRLDRKNW